MSTLRVSNIEAKADASSPTIDEKVKITSSDGRVLVQIDGKTAGITSIGINTTSTSFTIDGNQNVQFVGVITAANVNTTGVSTFSTLRATSIVGVNTLGVTTAYVGSINDGPIAGARNRIINGDMAISQRGTSFSTINTYNLDRYRTFGGPITHTITQQDSISTYSPSRYALRAARNSGATETNELGIAQGIETQNSYALRGKTVTVSFRARCGANFSSASSILTVRVFTGTGIDESPVSMTGQNADVSQSVTLTTSLQTFSVTGTLSASLTQATLAFSYSATGTAGTNDWFEITDVQLEPGPVATPFERRPIGTELALCQRYFQKGAVGPLGAGKRMYNNTGGFVAMNVSVDFPVTMRTSPTITVTVDISDATAIAGGAAGINNTIDGFTAFTNINNGAFLDYQTHTASAEL